MSPYDEAAAAFLEAAAPVAAYCERTARPNKHADMLETFLLRAADMGAEADNLQRGYEGSQRIRDFCARVRATIANITSPPAHFQPLAGSITSHCLPLPIHVRPAAQPLCHPAPHSESGDTRAG